MDPLKYDQWYQTSRGRWIGGREMEMLSGALALRSGDSILDVGCGTGFFTRGMAYQGCGRVVGVDIAHESLMYGRQVSGPEITYLKADAQALPFADKTFDHVISMTALCFIDDEANAVREIIRVTRRRFALGLLNRNSVLWWQKGRSSGRGGYQGARWHTVRDALALVRGLPVHNVSSNTGIFLPFGGPLSKGMERLCPSALRFGSFILICGDVS